MADSGASPMDNRVLKDVLGRQVVQTVSRAKRPHDAPKPRLQKTTPPEKCFFCPGNESMTPPEIDRIERSGKWEIRTFPNKFPAFNAQSKKAYGRHEVVVETPDHSKTLSELSEGNLADYLLMLKRRVQSAYEDPRLKYACVFKNEGRDAGASLEHSHTQVAAMDFVPKHVLRVGKKAKAIAALPQKQPRSVHFQNKGFAALCPKGSRFVHETWIIPLFPCSSILELDDGQLLLLAQALKSVLGSLDGATGFAPYNLLFHSAPKGEKEFTFHVQVLPRIATWAGFEFATEVVMSSASPVDSAKLLGGAAKEKVGQ